MLLASEKLRKISKTVFEVFSVPGSREKPFGSQKKPLEWRKNFHPINFVLGNIQIVHRFSVNDVDHIWNFKEEGTRSEENLAKVKASPKTQLVLEGTVIKCRDRIYCSVEDKDNKEKDIYCFEKPVGGIKVFIKEAAEVHKTEHFPEGIYHSSLFRMDVNPGEDYLCLEGYLPSDQMNHIASYIEKYPDAIIATSVSLLSFSFEVDDALREWWMPQTLFIDGRAFAPITGIDLSLKKVNSLEEENIIAEEANSEIKIEPKPQKPDNNLLLVKAIKRASIPLWILALLLALYLLK